VIELLIILSLVVSVISLFIFLSMRERNTGRKEQKLQNAQEVIKNVEKTKDAFNRLNVNQRKRLLDRYGRSS
tara:strand:+ start:1216 stop:1431 length:216 start_codon:yes stop_codon:yes gene_type:complete